MANNTFRIDYAIFDDEATSDDQTNTATLFCNDQIVLTIAQGDDETEEMLRKFASHALLVAKEVAKVALPEPTP